MRYECPKGCTQIETDTLQGKIYCMNCGLKLQIVANEGCLAGENTK